MKIHTLAEAQQTLQDVAVAAVAAHTPEALEQMRRCMAALGNPEERLRIIHIAGTSGKTSTAHYVSALLAATGARVGLSISPYTYTLNDRLRLNGEPLPERAFCGALGEFLEVYKKAGFELAYIPLLTAFAFWQLDRLKVEYAVIETNMGGQYDATNVTIGPDKISVITDIGLDHVAALGTTLPEIALKKAGIIRRGNQIFMLSQPSEVVNVVAEQARVRGAGLNVANARPPEPLRAKLAPLPLFQQRNWWLAKQIYEHVVQRDGLAPLTAERLEQAMRTLVPGRMEHFVCQGVEVILDVAHNPQKIGLLAESVQELYPTQTVAAMVMIGDGKDSRMMLGQLSALHPYLICSEYGYIEGLPHPARAAHILAEEAQGLEFDQVVAFSATTTALRQLLERPEPIKLVTGSLYGVSRVKTLIDSMQMI